MALLPIPDDFGQGGANIGDGEVRLVDILRSHAAEIEDLEAGSVDATARAAAATAQATADGAVAVNVTQSTNITTAQTTANNAASAAATAQATADGAVAVNVTQSTNITSAAAAAAAAQASANAAAAAAATAQTTANGAVSVNTTQDGRLDALEAASSSPVFFDEKIRALFKTLNPTGSPDFFYSDTLDGFNLQNGANRGHERPSVVVLDGDGSAVQNGVYRAQSGGNAPFAFRQSKWVLAASIKFFGTVAAASSEWRALIATPSVGSIAAGMIGVGVFEDIDGVKFSFRLKGDNAVVEVLSTVNYSAGNHIVAIWYDGTSYYGKVDNETAILLSSSVNDVPDGAADVGVFNIDSTQETWADAIAWGWQRT